MIAKRSRKKAGGRKARSRRWKEADLAQTHANPTARVDSIVVKGGRSRSHLKAPRIKAEAEGKVREGSAAIEISGKVNKKNKTGELEVRG